MHQTHFPSRLKVPHFQSNPIINSLRKNEQKNSKLSLINHLKSSPNIQKTKNSFIFTIKYSNKNQQDKSHQSTVNKQLQRKQISTVKSMVFLNLKNNQIKTNFQMGKLDSMAKIAQNNFDDSKDFLSLNVPNSPQNQYFNINIKQNKNYHEKLSVPQVQKNRNYVYKSFVFQNNKPNQNNKLQNKLTAHKIYKKFENFKEQKAHKIFNQQKPAKIEAQNNQKLNTQNHQNIFNKYSSSNQSQQKTPQLHSQRLIPQKASQVVQKKHKFQKYIPIQTYKSKLNTENICLFPKEQIPKINLHKQIIKQQPKEPHQQKTGQYKKQFQQYEMSTNANTPVKTNFEMEKMFSKKKNITIHSDNKIQTSHKFQNDKNIFIQRTFSIDQMNSSFQFQQQLPQNYLTLNNFQMGDKLGKGAFGDVYIARQKQTGFLCVLKKMSKKRIKQQKREQHVIRQIKIQLYLYHKHLTSLYGYFDCPQNIYLIMQYLPDGDLSSKRKKKSCQKQAAQIIQQVCQGLQYMHNQNIIHRDLKPQNIFVHSNFMKIGDFGCSVMTQNMRNTVVSCLEYSSPEQLNHQAYDQKIDVWSVGILTYQLLTGRSPYEHQIVSKIKQGKSIIFDHLKFPEHINISHCAKDFILSLLHCDPIERITIDEALEHKFITLNTRSE